MMKILVTIQILPNLFVPVDWWYQSFQLKVTHAPHKFAGLKLVKYFFTAMSTLTEITLLISWKGLVAKTISHLVGLFPLLILLA